MTGKSTKSYVSAAGLYECKAAAFLILMLRVSANGMNSRTSMNFKRWITTEREFIKTILNRLQRECWEERYMNRFTNCLCLGIWVAQLVYGVYATVGGIKIHPIFFFCATAICIVHYLEEVFGK